MSMLIAVEGIDGSGKGTQAKRLHKRLHEAGYDSHLLSFPRYQENPWGKLVGKYLNGDFGPLDQVHPQLAAALYAGDRWATKHLLLAQWRVRDVVICDRYVASNIAHQCARLEGDRDQKIALAEWIRRLEFVVHGMPEPDVTLWLDMPVEQAVKLIARKGDREYTDKTADLHEADAEYLQRVREVYRELVQGAYENHDSDYVRSGCWKADCVDSEGQLVSIDKIGDVIYEEVVDRLK